MNIYCSQWTLLPDSESPDAVFHLQTKAHVCELWRHAAWPEGSFQRMTKQARVLDEAQNGDLVLIPCVQTPYSPLLLSSSSLVPSLFLLYSHFLPAFLHGFPGPPSLSIPLWVGGRLNGHVWMQRGQMKEWLTHGEGGWGGRAAARSFREWGIPCEVPEVERRSDHGGKKEETCLRQLSSAGSATLPKRPSSFSFTLEVRWSVGDPYWCVYATAMSLQNFGYPMHNTACVIWTLGLQNQLSPQCS